MTKDHTTRQDAGEDREFKFPMRIWVVGGALMAVGLMSVVLLLRPSSFGSRSETAVHVFSSEYPPDISSYNLVEEDSVNMPLHRPFYTPTTLDALHKGDLLCIEVTGHGLWRQNPNPKFRTVNITPDGPEEISVDSKGREVPINVPQDLSARSRRNEFPHQSARMATLVAAVGTWTYNDGRTKQLDKHFIVGTKRWLRVDGRVSKDTQVLFTLNVRFREGAWHDTEGTFHIITRVYRLRDDR
jgi:hypothetical protein